MNDFLVLSVQTFYLAIVLLVLGEGLKGLSFIKKEKIIFLLLVIGICINFIFYGINYRTLLEGTIAASLAVFIYDFIKQAKKLLK